METFKEVYNRHPFQIEEGIITIQGYSDIDPDKCMCFVVKRDGILHFTEFGIAEDSVLLTCRGEKLNDGDLVIVLDEAGPAVHRYHKRKKGEKSGGDHDVPTITDARKAYSKVLGSFNFFH